MFIPKEALNQHIAILGKTGSGKSYTAKLIVEHLVQAVRGRFSESVKAAATGKNERFVAGNVARQELPKPTRNIPNLIPTSDGSLSKAERQILIAFYWLISEDATPAKVAFYSGYAASSGGFNNALGKLRSSGLLHGWRITEPGAAKAEKIGVTEKPSGRELREWLRRKLSKAENALLDALESVHPNRIGNEELAELSGYAVGSGGFNNALRKLRTIEAAVGYERDGGTKAADVFFE